MHPDTPLWFKQPEVDVPDYVRNSYPLLANLLDEQNRRARWWNSLNPASPLTEIAIEEYRNISKRMKEAEKDFLAAFPVFTEPL